MNDDQIIYCSRCGEEMKMSSRYCMKCGNLNPNHPDNLKYKKYLKKVNTNQIYTIGNGVKLSTKSGNLIGNNIGNRKMFLIFNISLLVIACIVFLLCPILFLDNINFMNIINSNILVNAFFIGIIELYFLSLQILFMKTNKPWWTAIIPFYNLYILNEIVFTKKFKWLFILNFVPIVNFIYIIVLWFKLGKSFGKNGILTVLFSFIMIPIIAFGSSSYNGNYYSSSEGLNTLHTDYVSNKNFFEICLFLIIIGLIVIGFNTDFLNKFTSNSSGGINYTHVKSAYHNIKKAVVNNNYDCDGYMVVGQTYYFYSDDFIYDYALSSSISDQATGYFKVIYNGDNSEYYVSYYYNGNYLPEININDLKTSSFTKVDVDTFAFNQPVGNFCTLD